MQPPWKLVVEGLGPISHAEIEARPLLLFVGDNSTGKTYVASLLWGLLTLGWDLEVAHGDAYRRCVSWIEERFERREQEPTFEITPEVHADLVQLVNDTLQEERAVLAERTFRRAGFTVGKIELRDVPHRKDDPIRWVDGNVNERSSPLIRTDTWLLSAQNANRRAQAIELLAGSLTFGQLQGARKPLGAALDPRDAMGPVFLPASRTGFMLLYRNLAQQLINDSLHKTRSTVPDLTEPAIDFINLLVRLRSDVVGAYPEEAAFLERAMGGRLLLRTDIGLPEVLWEHTKGEPPLPMELSSAIVTELAPVILTLRYMSGYKVLILEEPEAHLHPHLQRVLAQVVVRLIRKGLFVWITTHSENFCQQINNFLKIGALSPDKRAKVGRSTGTPRRTTSRSTMLVDMASR